MCVCVVSHKSIIGLPWQCINTANAISKDENLGIIIQTGMLQYNGYKKILHLIKLSESKLLNPTFAAVVTLSLCIVWLKHIKVDW